MYIAVVLAEMISEAALLGVLFGLLTIPGSMGTPTGSLAGIISVVAVLFLHGYYFTRPLCGILWTGRKSWVYASVSALLFVIHTGVAVLRLRPSFTPEAVQKAPVFIVLGAVAVFSCAFGGGDFC